MTEFASTLPPLALNPVPWFAPGRGGYPLYRGRYPFVGHMPAIATDFLGLIRRASERHGPMFWLDLGFGRSGLHVMQPEAFTLFKHKSLTSAQFGEDLGELFGKSILAQDGVEHQRARTAMTPAFQPRGLDAAKLGDAFASLIEQRIKSWPERGEMRLLVETRELVLSLVFSMLGVPQDEVAEWAKNYADLMLLALNFPLDFPGSPLRKGRRARTWLNERLVEHIKHARENPDTPGLLAQLVKGRDDQGEALGDEQLVDNLRLLALAGHETAASVIAWMIATLAETPSAWDALVAEAKEQGGPPRSPRDIRRFPFSEALFRETLRLYPPAHVDSRRAIEDVDFLGHVIPAGTDVTIPIIHLSRHESVYESPDAFKPERWLNRTEGLSALEMVQFGGGPHFCLGYHVAWLEAVQVAITMALVLDERGMRPRLPDGRPQMRYLPLLHPTAKTRIAFG